MRLERIVNVADARSAARRELPGVVFDYVDGAADDEVTMRENVAAFERVALRPRMGRSVQAPDLATTVLGTPVSMPVLLAPCGLVRAMHPDAGPGVARAAASRGTVSVLSTVAGSPVASVVPAAPGRVWFQLYSAGGRPVADALCAQAEEAGVRVLVVTLDTPALGNRERDLRHGVAPPLRIDVHSALHLGPQVLTRPRWAWRMARDGLSLLGRPGRSSAPRAGADVNAGLGPPGRPSGFAGGPARPPAGASVSSAAAPPPPAGASVSSAAAPAGPAAAGEAGGLPLGASPSGSHARRMLSMAASPFSWDDVAWLRERWHGPLAVKGLLSGDDARRAVSCGADAVIVSNHGGRQLDGAPSTISVLPEVAAAVADEGAGTEVFLDSGIRRGTHVVKALALGARAVFIGRPYLYGLAAGGQAGVERVLDIFQTELQRTMVLLGCPSVAELGPDWVSG